MAVVAYRHDRHNLGTGNDPPAAALSTPSSIASVIVIAASITTSAINQHCLLLCLRQHTVNTNNNGTREYENEINEMHARMRKANAIWYINK